MTLELTFLILSLVFAGILIVAGFVTRKWIQDSSDFILAGREVSLALNIFGVAAIGFAGTSIALSPGFAVLYGFRDSFVSLGIIYALGGLSLYGAFFTTFIRRCGAQTLPEWLEMRFDNRVRLVVTLGTILGLTGIMANNVVAMAGVVTGFTGWPIFATVSAIFFVFLLFSYMGGFWAITFTDFLQLVLGLVAIPVIVFTFLSQYGDLSWVAANWPGGDYLTQGVTGNSMSWFSLKYPSYLTFAFLFAAFLVWGNNYYWLRAASCRSERAAKLSYVWAGILLCVVFYIPLTLVGSYTGAAYPDLFAPIGKTPAVAAFGVFLREIPIFIASFLLLVSLAAGISTATTAHIGATSVAVRDIYQRRIRPEATPQELVVPSRLILLALGILVWLLCFYPGGPIYLFAFATAWLGPPSILVFLGVVWKRFTAQAALWSALISIGVMVVLTLLQLTKVFAISQYMHVGIAGLIAGIVPAVLVSLATRPRYYGQPGWERVPTAENREEVHLKEADLKVLGLIRQGFENMSELSDVLGMDASRLNEIIEKLDRGGYLVRQSLFGSGFYTFAVSDAGEAALPKMSEVESALAADRLTPESLRVLRIVQEAPGRLADLVKSGEFTSLKVSAILAKLIRNGYVREGGLFKRTLAVSEAGSNLLEKYRGVGVSA